MLVSNLTNQDYWFGPLHLAAGATNVTVDDTSSTSLYLTDDAVADAINTLVASGKISVSGAASPFPRPISQPEVIHGDGSPEGLVYASQGTIYLRRDVAVVFQKTTGIHLNTGWAQLGIAGGITGTVIGDLGVGSDGKVAQLRIGASPYEFLQLIYDATYGHWVSGAQLLVQRDEEINVNSTSYVDTLQQPALVAHWSDLRGAGLTPQFKFDTWTLHDDPTPNPYENYQIALTVGSQNANPSSNGGNNTAGSTGAFITEFGTTVAGGSIHLQSLTTGWIAPGSLPAAADLLSVKGRFKSSGTSYGKHLWQQQISMRWIG